MPAPIRDPVIRTTPRPSDINLNGHIFGGWILSQMDIAGGIAAIRETGGGAVATVAIEAMTFHRPVLLTDWVSVYADVVGTGRTSITVHIEVAAMRRGADAEVMVTEGTFVYVHIDSNGKPLPLTSNRPETHG
ncbi:MAG: acyl-CoA thioesterase [Alphaproteobacteria bacterium]|nr:MAG: acyl-CoA thioesterase [Alphaproteobacteria bacterium]